MIRRNIQVDCTAVNGYPIAINAIHRDHNIGGVASVLYTGITAVDGDIAAGVYGECNLFILYRISINVETAQAIGITHIEISSVTFTVVNYVLLNVRIKGCANFIA